MSLNFVLALRLAPRLMKYFFSALFFPVFLFLCSPVYAEEIKVITGVQLPSEKAISRLIPSQYGFKWIKFQYSLGSDQLPFLPLWIKTARDKDYKVLISVAKNKAGIETLKNPGTDYQTGQKSEVYSKFYCPWDEELETYTFPQTCFNEETGKKYNCPEIIKAQAKADNGYVKFRDAMKDLAPTLSDVGAVEIWNEPNMAEEWSDQGLGTINPENYANFFICGAKGLKKGGYTGKIISAAPAPNTPDDVRNMNDITFLTRFYKVLSDQNQLGLLDGVGWHGNIPENIPPEDPNPRGFQRFTSIIPIVGNKKIWLTEYGWKRPKTDNATEEEKERQKQAGYIADAVGIVNNINIANKTNRVEAMFVWNFGFTKENPEPSFALWDIEGSVPMGTLCQPNARVDNPPERGRTNYVQDTTLSDDNLLSSVAAKALIPKTVNEDTASKSANVIKTEINVAKNFLDNIPGLIDALKSFGIPCIDFSRIPIFGGFLNGILGNYCTPTISVGSEEKLDKNQMAPGKNTAQLGDSTQVLGKISQAEGMKLIPEKRDCNLVGLSLTSQSRGNEKMNQTSSGLGTSAGFYGTGQIDFKTMTPEDYEASMQARMVKENLNISNKLFDRDRRSPDIYLRKQIMCKGFYPNGICPFEPPPAGGPTP